MDPNLQLYCTCKKIVGRDIHLHLNIAWNVRQQNAHKYTLYAWENYLVILKFDEKFVYHLEKGVTR